jgi:hypothetical protein
MKFIKTEKFMLASVSEALFGNVERIIASIVPYGAPAARESRTPGERDYLRPPP